MTDAPTLPQRAPSTGEPTVVANDVHVHYNYGISQARRLRSLLTERRKADSVVHAVKGVTLVAHRGDVIGLLGRNGAGKTTLLRAMTGLLPVSSGSVHARSQPVRLGVGAALQRMLPARENIILGGLSMGMTREEVTTQVDDIVRFAGLGHAADRPLHTYSSGMRARLQFAIATAAKPEIIMVDEALAVGDQAFKRRSMRRLRELAGDAGTVFVVSHSMNQIRNLCNRGVWLEQGRVRMDADLDTVASAYTTFMQDQN